MDLIEFLKTLGSIGSVTVISMLITAILLMAVRLLLNSRAKIDKDGVYKYYVAKGGKLSVGTVNVIDSKIYSAGHVIRGTQELQKDIEYPDEVFSEGAEIKRIKVNEGMDLIVETCER